MDKVYEVNVVEIYSKESYLVKNRILKLMEECFNE